MSASKQKGTAAETAVVRYLQSRGARYVERRTLSGAHDKGDIAGISDVVIEVKSVAKIDLAGFLAEAEVEKANAKAGVGVAWIKKRGKTDPGEWYVLMSGAQFVDLLRDGEYL